jgi:hypothetical protein
MIAAGLGPVVADLRYNGFDLIPDLMGWAVVLSGLAKLVGRSPWFTAGAVAAACGVLVGLPLLLAEPGPLLSAVEGVVLAVVVFGTCTGIRDVVANERTRGTANLFRWAELVLTLVALPATLLVGPTEVTGTAAFGVVVGVLAALAFFACFLVFLWSNRSDPALGAPSPVSRPDPVR